MLDKRKINNLRYKRNEIPCFCTKQKLIKDLQNIPPSPPKRRHSMKVLKFSWSLVNWNADLRCKVVWNIDDVRDKQCIETIETERNKSKKHLKVCDFEFFFQR